MNRILLILVFFNIAFGLRSQEEAVEVVLDAWHRAASDADYEAYFGLMTDDAVFIGTDATENWQNEAFRSYAKPHFDQGSAWHFTALQRNIYLNKLKDIAWFDELLDTQMKICRGSGVLIKIDGRWKISHYVLSISVPNDKVGELIDIKKEKDSILIVQLKVH